MLNNYKFVNRTIEKHSRLKFKQSRKTILFLFMFIVIICALTSKQINAQVQDITPPTLNAYSYSPTSVDVRTTGQYVSVSINASDDLSGIDYAGAVFFSPSRNQSAGGSVSFAAGATSGTAQVFFSSNYVQGTWILGYIYVRDKVGNQRTYYNPAYSSSQPVIPSGGVTTVSVTSNVTDITPPVLTDFDFSPTSVDTSSSSAIVNMTATATDDISGVNIACAYFQSPPNSANQTMTRGGCMSYPNSTSTTLQGNFSLPRYSAAGTWNLIYIYLVDKANNYQYFYSPTYCPSCSQQIPSGIPTQLNVTSNPSDNSPPTINSFDFTPKAIDVATSSQNVSFTANVTDDFDSLFGGNNVNSVSVLLYSPGFLQNRSVGFTRSPGTNTWTGTVNFPQYSAAGNWVVYYVYTTDSLGNNRIIYQNDLKNLGFPTTLQISSGLSVSNAAGTYGGTTTLSATLTNAGSPVPGKLISFYLNNSSISIGSATTDSSGAATLANVSLAGLNANTYFNGIKASFAGDSGLSAISGTADLAISKATATLSFSNLSKTYNGSQQTPSVTTNPTGLSGVSFTFNGSTTAPTNVGSYTVVASLNNTNYTATSVTDTFVINPATATINLSNLSQTYNGLPRSVSVSTTPTAAGSGGFTVTYDGSTAPPTNAGTYAVEARLNNTNYTATPATGNLVINKANQSISFGALGNKTFGDAPFGVSATASSGLPVSFSIFSGPATISGNTVTITGAGMVVVRASQAGDNNYNAAANFDRSFTVAKANAAVTLSNLAQTYDGTAKSAGYATNPANLNVSLTYNGSSTAPTNAGSYNVAATINDANYQGSATGTLVISKATPVVSWSNPSDITYGTALGAAQLNATASVSGSFAYAPASGTKLNAGNGQTLSVTFTPIDTMNFNSAAGTVQINVLKATPSITVTGGQFTADGNPHPAIGFAYGIGGELDVLEPAVTFTYLNLGDNTSSNNAPVNPGIYKATATFAGNSNYDSATGSATLYIYSATCEAPKNGLQYWWKAEGNANEIINGSNGTLQNGATFGTGRVGQAFNLDGSDDYVELGYLPQIQNAGQITVMAWVNKSSSTPSDSWAGIVGKWNTNGEPNNSFLLYNGEDSGGSTSLIHKGRFVINVAGSPTEPTQNFSVGGSTVLPTDQWVLIAATWNNIDGKMTLYKNGISDGSRIWSGTIGKTITYHEAFPATIGEWGRLRNSKYKWNGRIDEVQILNRALSADEVRAIYLANTLGVCPPAATTTTVQPVSTDYSPNDQSITLNAAVDAGGAPVNAGTVKFTVSNGSVIGSPVNSAVTGGSASAVYTLPAGTSPQDLTITASYSDVGGVAYQYSTGSAALTVNKAAPAITWNNPADITYGEALGATQLNATASVSGSFVYYPAGGILNAGTHTLSVNFTPTDPANYTGAAASVSINVLKAGQTITFDPLADKNYGDAPFALNAAASSNLPVDIEIVSGPATIANNIVTIAGAGIVKIKASQAGDGNYNAAPDVVRTFTVFSNECVPLLSSGLLAWYRGENNGGDSSGSGKNAMLKNGATFAPGRISRGFSFDGADDFVQVPHSPDLNVQSSLSGEAWIYPESFPNVFPRIFEKGSGNFNRWLFSVSDDGKLQLNINSSFATTDANAIPLNRWSHVAFTYDGATGDAKLFINGVQHGSTTNIGIQTTNNTASLDIGGLSAALTRGFDGLIDEAKVYNRVLSVSEIESHYLTNSGFCQAVLTTTVPENAAAIYSPSDQSVTLSAAVNPDAGAAVGSGTVTFSVKDAGGATIGSPVSADVSDGAALASYTLPGGTPVQNLTVQVEYDGGLIYRSSSGQSLLTIGKATPTLSWNNPADITYGTALSPAQLNAMASVPGSFVYSPAGGVLNAGTHTLSVDFTPDDTTNYSNASANVSITVLPASLTIKADDKSRTYGSNPVGFTVTPAGLVNGDTLSGLGGTLAFNFTDAANKPAGTHTITPSGLTSSNYSITFQDGTLTVGKAALTVRADNAGKTYGAVNPTFTAQYAGFVLGENESVLGGALVFNTPADQSSSVGSYAVTPAGLTSGNYDISFVAGKLQITPAALTVKTNDASKTYGDAPVVFSVSYNGFVNNDTASGLGGTLAFDLTDTANTPAGSYTVKPSGLTSPDYNITFEGGTFTVSKAGITVIANDASRSYGAANPAFSGTLTGVRNGDNISDSYSTTADATSPVGTYAITPALSDPDGKLVNYAVAYTDGTLTIGKAPLTVTAYDAMRLYKESNPAFTGVITGIQNNDVITDTYETIATIDSPVGTYPIVPNLTGDKLGNYEVTKVEGTLTINKANQVINWSNPASISYVTPLGNAQLNAALTTGDGSLTYSPGAGTLLSVGSHQLRVDASETANYNPASKTVTIEVTNALPTANAGGTYDVYEGGSVELKGSGADPEGLAVSCKWDLDGDGTFETAGQNVMFSAVGMDGFTGSSKIVKLRVTDELGSSTASTATVKIHNVAPTVTTFTGPVDPKAINTTINLTMNYTDPAGALDIYTMTTDWGDGTVDNNTSHVYTAAGVYRVKAKVSDEDGGVSNEAIYEYVVVYDPSAGFVTGGGWIMSPAGAYPANPSLTGKATFGFVSKYQKGANQPTGNTEFQFNAADFRFKSDLYDWLVVAGAKAQFKGIGSVNGVPGYSFMLTATDGQVNGGGGTDKFRIKIWNADGVVYDNVPNGSDKLDEANPQAIGGGSIVIHSGK